MNFEFLLESSKSELYILGQAAVALLLGGLIGWEREAAGKWAGLRTHMLVCLASMMFVRVGQFLILDSSRDIGSEILRMDPVRLIEAIVTGIAFLGAGTVFRDPEAATMRGLTTAASLLLIAPIGVAIAIDRYVLAVGITLLALFVLRIVSKLEAKIPQPPQPKE